jgi:hypothetical protein
MQTENPNQLPTSILAIVSLIAGILSVTGLPLIGSVVAIFAGMQARKETRAVPPVADGDNLATIGIVLGWISLALALALCCLWLFFVSLSFVTG